MSGVRLRLAAALGRSRQLQELVARRTSEIQANAAEMPHQKQELELALGELSRTKDRLVEEAHKAGMADIATGVLHNVGNLLNSVNVSRTVIQKTLDRSRVGGLAKANALLRDHSGDLGSFLTSDERGKRLLEYYFQLEKVIGEEHRQLIERIDPTEREGRRHW